VSDEKNQGKEKRGMRKKGGEELRGKTKTPYAKQLKGGETTWSKAQDVSIYIRGERLAARAWGHSDNNGIQLRKKRAQRT